MVQERLTIDEIYNKYPDKWIFISDCETNANTELTSGIVLYAGDSKEKAYEISANYIGFGAVRYSGDIPEDVIFLF